MQKDVVEKVESSTKSDTEGAVSILREAVHDQVIEHEGEAKKSDETPYSGLKKRAAKLVANLKTAYIYFKAFMFAASAEEARYRRNTEERLLLQIRPAATFGGIVLLVGFSFFIVWGGLAPLDSAAIAEGTIVLTGNRKVVQHFDGGIIEEIFVKEGQAVSIGEKLIKLQDTHAKTSVQIFLSQLRFAKALERRLMAEESSADVVDFSDPILDMNDTEVQMIVQNQRSLFDSHRNATQLKIQVCDQRIAQAQEDIKAHEANEKSLNLRIASVKEQLEILTSLYKKGLESRTRILEVEQRYATLQAELHAARSGIAKAKEQISEMQLNKIEVENSSKNRTFQEYKENRSHVIELEQKLESTRDVLQRTTLVASDSGIVTGLQYHTIGGVIRQGDKVMEIIPQDDQLIAEVHVAPQFIESLYVGLEAKVQLNAYKSRLVPRVIGEVIYVSADKFSDDKGHSFYIVKIALKQSSIDSINMDIKLYPGMPVTAYVVRGTRTFLQYMISPIVESFHRAFKET